MARETSGGFSAAVFADPSVECGQDLIDLVPEHHLRADSTGPATNLPSFEPRPCPLASCRKQAKANMVRVAQARYRSCDFYPLCRISRPRSRSQERFFCTSRL